MNEYRVKGLSCGHCAQTLENEIRGLEHGATAKLSFNSGKLLLDERVSLDKVKAILKSERAYIDQRSESEVQAQSNQDLPAHTASGLESSVSPSPLKKSSGRENDHGHSHSHSHDHDNDHNHDHQHGQGTVRMIALLAVSAVIYLGAMAMDGLWSARIVVPLYLAAAALSGYSTFYKGLRNLLRLKFNIDTLMTIALVGAVSIGEWKEATLVAILFGLNELLEGLGMEKARRSMEALLNVAPKEAVRLEEDGRETTVPIAALRVGDTVIVKPGAKIPSDGVVARGRSSVNEAAITGESLPVEKAEGQAVFGGSLNNEGLLHVRIDKAYRDSSLAKILHLVEEAQETKTPTELFINKFAKYYTPLIMLVAVLVIAIPPLLLNGSWTEWLYQGLAVLIVGCPCALILSSPIAIIAGIARNARHGILIKGGVHLEQLGKLDTLAFDKTGTLTKGEPHVEKMLAYDDRLLEIAGAIENASSHPLAKAIMKEVRRAGIAFKPADSVRAIPGRGVEAEYESEAYTLGSESSLTQLSLPPEIALAIDEMKQEGLTLVLVADRRRVLGLFGIADEIREESPSVISDLRRSGIRRTVILTGDHQKTAEKVANAVGIDEAIGGLLPQDKVSLIQKLSRQGTVGMIGDGINDAPALATAQLGIAMGKGTDSAIETADIVLMQDHLGKLPGAIRLSRRVNRTIAFNICVSMGLKLLALALAVPGWLTLWVAILSDMGATVFVTLVSLTILIERK
ncbi:heavy metal translocating P-type ATPase [Cohnella boryungensis]|uniref:Cd(2+)-exporting ATPase n=1 Tax=Cohnella boryungensis TaxID=768479 RepID=A0ABV8SAX3_9BACL